MKRSVNVKVGNSIIAKVNDKRIKGKVVGIEFDDVNCELIALLSGDRKCKVSEIIKNTSIAS